MNKVKSVEVGSIAEEVEIQPGDQLISVNGHKIEDIIDFMFLMAETNVVLEVEKYDGELWEIEIDKDPDEDLGITFENPIIDEAKRCSNNCVFCFIDQLPQGMRETLYFKDDDSRLSFLQGNFVTLTNMSEEKIKRIVDYKISPINVSVHTTNPDLRVKMLGNRFAGKIMDQLKNLTSHGIVVNAQIVLCPGYNDGPELEKTIRDLETLGENLNSVAVVPIGLTKHRDNLPVMEAFERQSAQGVVDQIENLQKEIYLKRKSNFVFIADEFYIKADRDFPSYESYEGFLQFEDGVGMLRKLIDEVKWVVEAPKAEMSPDFKRRVAIVTGRAAGPFIKTLARDLENAFEGLIIDVFEVINDFFGHRITVSGLLTGKDIMAQVDLDEDVECILMPINMFRADETVMLDDIYVSDIEAYFNKPVVIVDTPGKAFVDAIVYGGKNE